jgi:hypothetical protein
MHGIGFTRTGRSTALVDSPDSAILTKDNRAAGEGFQILGMPDTQTRDIGDGVVQHF